MPIKKDVLRDTDHEARRLAKTLMREARHAALAVLDPLSSVPMASRVAVACDVSGAPLILISQLSGHFGAIAADARCSLLFGEPGKGDPLAHARVTVMAEAERLAGDARLSARERFLRYHPKAALYADFGDFAFWRLVPTGASLNGGFGKAFALTAQDLATAVPDGLDLLEPDAARHMNDDHADAVALYAGMQGDWSLLGLDAEGLDLAQGDRRLRRWFDCPLTKTDELRPKLVALVKQAKTEKP
jgi:putative heme iron utilization protein